MLENIEICISYPLYSRISVELDRFLKENVNRFDSVMQQSALLPGLWPLSCLLL